MFEVPGLAGPQEQARKERFSTMAHVVQIRSKRKPGCKPQRLLYRGGITRDELTRLVTEVGRDQVEAVLRALDLSAEAAFSPAE